ncbi:MAG: ABC transporter ATP-binding protein/permease [Alphaproteobacteria bacterium]|nr:ABC transporter ATP-binding protein/permease [Alphaproteobacteria bacterium]MBV9967098.1 ABC transporter ATP-binding protein/permease [Alphaproteobacteria bacterium]
MVGRSSITGLPEPKEKLAEGLRAVKGLGPYLWPRDSVELRARVVLAVALLIAGKLVNITVPLLYKRAVDALSAPGGAAAAAIAVPVGVILAYGLARVMAQGFNQLRDGVFAKVAQRAVRRIALSAFRHIHSLSLRFHLERRTGGLARAIERGIAGIEFLLSFMLFNVIPTLFEIIVVSAILWRLYNWQFAAVTLATILVYIAFTFIVTDWRVRFRREMNERNSEANTKSVDSLLNYETVKYFANEAHEAERYDRALRAYERAAVKSETTLAMLNLGQGTIIAIGLIGIMLLAGEGVAAGRMTIGDFVLVNTYLIQLYQPLNFLGMVYRNIKQSLTDLEQMMSLVKIRPEIEDRPGAPALAVTRGAVAFRHVDFRYDPRREILRDVDFVVAPGAKVAIVGPSGAGKSTIARLLFRFYDVTDGAIEIDGEDIRDVTQDSLRRAIGVVPQDTVLFNDTIYYNIAYGQPGASRAEIEEAARLAHIHDFIASLPDGYQTMVGERGLKLSGGEKQRVAIARVILKAPRILIFDEATSALDTKTEREIQASLAEVAAGHTTLVIAHRLSTVVDADQILVLEHGRIVERGDHRDLLSRGGIYAAMWARQQEAARLEIEGDEPAFAAK